MDTTGKATAKQVLGQYISDIVDIYRSVVPDSVFMKDTATAIKYYQDGRERDSYCMLIRALGEMDLNDPLHHLHITAAHLIANESYDKVWMPKNLETIESTAGSHLEQAVNKAIQNKTSLSFFQDVYRALCNPDDAIAIYRGIDSENLERLSELGEMYLKHGLYTEAYNVTLVVAPKRKIKITILRFVGALKQKFFSTIQ